MVEECKEESKIYLEKLEKIIVLITTKKEDPDNRDLSFFGWDNRYEIHGKLGAIFDDIHGEVSMLRLLGLKDEYWHDTYRFFDFGQLLSLYPYSTCILEELGSYRHRDDVQNYIIQIKDLEDALKSIHQQLKNVQKNTINKVISCVKK